MDDKKKTKEQLVQELNELRQQIVKLEKVKTKHKQTEEALRESEKRYKRVIESASEIIYTTDVVGKFTFANSAALKITGYSLEEFQQLNYLDLIHPDHRRRTAEISVKQFRGKKPTTYYEFPFLTKSGEVIWLGQNSSLIFEGEKVGGFHSVARDITERKLVEEEARQLAKENAIMAEIGRIVSSTLKIEEVYEGFAQEMRKVIDFDRVAVNVIDPEEGTFTIPYVAGSQVIDRWEGDIIPVADTATEEILRTGSSLLIQEENWEAFTSRYPGLLPIFKAGFKSVMMTPLISRNRAIGVLNVQSNKAHVYTEKELRITERISAQIAGAIANAQLFSERQRSEEALRESEERYRNILANIEDGYYEVDIEGNFTFFNDALCRMLGYSEDEMIGMK